MKKFLELLKPLEPKDRLLVFMPAIAAVVVFSLFTRITFADKADLKAQVKDLQYDKDSIRHSMQLQIDDCNNERYQNYKERNEKLEKILRGQDSVKESLKKLN